MVTLQKNNFDSANALIEIIHEIADKKIYVVGFHITNNSTTHDSIITVLEHGGGVPTIALYGSKEGSGIYLTKNGGPFELPEDSIIWFETSVNNKDISLHNIQEVRLSGFIIFYQD